MDHLRIVERPHDLEYPINGPNVGKEGIAETCTGGGAGCETGDVDTCQEGGDTGFWLVDFAEPFEARVRDGDTSFFGVA